MTPNERVTVVTVTYNSSRVLPSMLETVPAETPLVIVDNNSPDIADVRTLAESRGARLIANTTNEGFGVACNRGAAVAETEFLLFLNPDAQLSSGALAELVLAAERYPAASGMNPRILGANGEPFFRRRSHLLPRAQRMKHGSPTADCEVNILTGAALFVRRQHFEAVGGFDPEIFLFYEDDDLTLRLRKAIGPAMFVHAATVRHVGGSSSPQTSTLRLKAWHMGSARVYTTRKHGMRWARSDALAKAVLRLASPAVLMSSQRRAEQMSYLRGVLHGIARRKSQR